MWLTQFFVVLVTLTGIICLSNNAIEINKPDGFAELEEASIKMLTTCYANQDKTIVLVGNFPENFIRRMSSHRSFSVALLDDRRRTSNNIQYSRGRNQDTTHKVHIFVMRVSHYKRNSALLTMAMHSPYYNSMAAFLILGWSRENKYTGCDGKWDTIDILANSMFNNILNANLICRDYTKGIVIYSSNPYAKQAPEPWRFVKSFAFDGYPLFSYFMQEYRENEGMCNNLHFKKTRELSGSPIKLVRLCVMPYCSNEAEKKRITSRHGRLQNDKRFSFIENFFTYVNATIVYNWVEIISGRHYLSDDKSFVARPSQLKGISGSLSYAYPHGTECKFLITQFRGNKSQLEKILSVIDSYSWYGMFVVYAITLMFFKYFLHQPLLVAMLNVLRLTCNFGLTMLPPNVAPRIYLGCLLFFVVTMQGIFVGNLAALLTQDIPVRQVDSVQDLADLGYTIRAQRNDFMYFNESIIKSRLILELPDNNCTSHVLHDPLTACLEWGSDALDAVSKYNLHRSPGCLTIEYVTNVLPWKWMLEERLNNFLGIIIGGGIMTPLNTLVDEKRMLEAESQEVPFEPRIMVFRDLTFAFVILGIGLTLAVTVFIIERLIYRFYCRVATTQVIVLN